MYKDSIFDKIFENYKVRMCEETFSSYKFNDQVFNFALEAVMQTEKEEREYDQKNLKGNSIYRLLSVFSIIAFILILVFLYKNSISIKY
jgi:hypothetical protein